MLGYLWNLHKLGMRFQNGSLIASLFYQRKTGDPFRSVSIDLNRMLNRGLVVTPIMQAKIPLSPGFEKPIKVGL